MSWTKQRESVFFFFERTNTVQISLILSPNVQDRTLYTYVYVYYTHYNKL